MDLLFCSGVSFECNQSKIKLICQPVEENYDKQRKCIQNELKSRRV